MTGVIVVYMGKERQPGACEIYRGNMPMVFLGRQNGWYTSWTYFDSIWSSYIHSGERGLAEFFRPYDVIVFPRLFIPDDDPKIGEAYAMFIQYLKSLGKRIVYEVDDDYTNRFRHVVNGDAMTPASWCDAITVTTPYLSNVMKPAGKPVHIIPNCFDPELWCAAPEPKRDPSKIVIGLSGSSTHQEDWRVLSEVLPALLEAHPHVTLRVTGYTPDYLQDLPNTQYSGPLSYETYSLLVRACDIILAPVNHDSFNLGKSPIKAIEGMAARRTLNGLPAGAAVIATDHPVYRLAIKPGETGLLARYVPESWYFKLETLIINHKMRHDLQIAGHKWAMKKHDISREWLQWAKAYQSILSVPSKISARSY